MARHATDAGCRLRERWEGNVRSSFMEDLGSQSKKKKKCYLSVQARVLQMAPLSPNISKDVCGGCRVVAGDGYKPSQSVSRLSTPALLKEEPFSLYLYYVLV